MREILFRGKRLDNGEWVQGDLMRSYKVYDKAHFYIGNFDFGEVDGEKIYEMSAFELLDCVEVDENTICQYTGLTDKNGKKIFENDIIKFIDGYASGYVEYGEISTIWQSTEQIQIGFYVNWYEGNENKVFLRVDLPYWAEDDEVEIIGNKFENSELCEVEE